MRTVVISQSQPKCGRRRSTSCHPWEKISQNAELNVTPCNGTALGRFPETLAFRRAVCSKRPAHQWKDASLIDALQEYGPHRYRALLQSTVRVRRLRTNSCAICRGGPYRILNGAALRRVPDYLTVATLLLIISIIISDGYPWFSIILDPLGMIVGAHSFFVLINPQFRRPLVHV